MLQNLPDKSGDLRVVGLISGSRRSSGGGYDNPLQYSCLEITWTDETGRSQSIGSQKVGHARNNLAHMHGCHHCGISYVVRDMFSKNKKHPDQVLPEYHKDALPDILVLLKKLSSLDKDIHISHFRSVFFFFQSGLL